MSEPFPELLVTLHETVRETFETLTFSEISSWEVTENWPDPTASWIGATIEIKQPFNYSVTLLIDHAQCQEFVETVYGSEITENPDIERILNDYVCELINTIAGRLAAALTYEDGKIELGLPIPNGEPSPADNQTVITFLLEGNEAWFFLEC